MIKSVIFDMDGVLIDARQWHFEAFNRALALFGRNITVADHLARFDGLPTKRKLEILAEAGNSSIPVSLHPFISEMKQKYTMEIVSVRCKPVFAQEYLLARLEHQGYRLAVASNSIGNTVQTMMRLARLDVYLVDQFCNEDVAEPKPSPEIYLLAMKKLGVMPEETLIVEDNANGIAAARASGAHVLAVRGTEDVTLQNVKEAISKIDARQDACSPFFHKVS
ncbi:putative phosphatase [Acetobacter malorum DSM 14337]|uniref:Phosphatase n=1 Tax=Acetobacter malorum DSM 14337 TaxID=1307910 RepID=A0ABQ0Q177_9PROT|nr:HAD family phosphatase [Acetobacter malorum]KXV06517.1 HAD family hydrolase [Acetobacter malorum]GBQ86617.1 putative phosphatase [Acetobacter malorum DSM 14337]